MDQTEQIELLRKIINESDNIVFFGGAGVSTESNIPDFRGSGGLYNEKRKDNIPVERIISHTCFVTEPEIFYEFYTKKMIFPNAEPNESHKALTKLEKSGKLKAVITQNIDGLHQKAGTKNVLELHGTVHSNYCMKCNKFFDLEYILKNENLPLCDECGGMVKPDVVLYEESLDNEVMTRAIEYIMNAKTLIIGGTSLTVHPAAGLIRFYKGNELIIINMSTTPYDYQADIVINESIGKVMKYVTKDLKI
ncbi:MAG: NAD-dependent protein deacylase [Methanosarcinaceae archaeon]|nr:NAD-dependent protein deacylase [Methanosarcinaceae archaeon]